MKKFRIKGVSPPPAYGPAVGSMQFEQRNE